ncbi:MAG: DUF2284 domain-containing protein [Desulfobulbus sp.]|uniref:DUF2284 domain-containing protein n=1 Tax=Desulfobulbus sp. TaxID=895 RepID=UPI00283DC185|nr:DUF2284 domain-containing protein [Desulfobulbus sp.]MDR2549116.1 DUF2284 domain-containing protein [Desulfobulbus sp.]
MKTPHRPGPPLPPSSTNKAFGPQQLLALAIALGATDAVLLPVEALVVEERYAAMCAAPHRCPSYGLAPGCPPHAPSPADFRARLAGFSLVAVFKIDVPAADLLNDNRLPVARSIHRIAAHLERAAPGLGFIRACGMAAGSCKELFCADAPTCAVLDGSHPCQHPDLARPSISAVGIDFAALADRAGWPFARIDSQTKEGEPPAMGLMAGLVLLA